MFRDQPVLAAAEAVDSEAWSTDNNNMNRNTNVNLLPDPDLFLGTGDLFF